MTQSELLGIVQNAGLLLAMAVVFDLLIARTDLGRTWLDRLVETMHAEGGSGSPRRKSVSRCALR